MKTIYTISIFILLTLNAFNQNTKATNTIYDKENAKKELNKILEAPSIDSVAFDKSEEQKTDKVLEEKTIYAPKPSKNAKPVEVKSEPVPGAEIIIDNAPDTPKKKKAKNSASSNQPNQDNKKNDDNKPNP